MSKKIISIICATFNAERTVEAFIKSVLAQKSEIVELIVIDGSSVDSTCSVLNKYKCDLDFFISEPDTGIYDAWNKGLGFATGEYISFIGADDELNDGAIRQYMDSIKGEAQYDLVSSQAVLNGVNGKPIGKPWKWVEFKRHMCINHVGALHHKSLFERFGKFNPRYKIAGDYEFLLRAGPSLRSKYIPKATVRVGVNGLSNTNIFLVLNETRLAKIENNTGGLVVTAVDMIFALFKFYLKKTLVLK